jgi:rhodanese-related sulfurtransferase
MVSVANIVSRLPGRAVDGQALRRIMGDAHRQETTDVRWFWQGLMTLWLAGTVGAALAADPVILTASDAYHKAASGGVLLVDIRAPEEWGATGIPAGSVPETIHGADGLPGFVHALLQRVDGDRTRPIALICRTGRRSALARAYLVDAGFTDVRDVAEGLAGGPNGTGWQPSGLPVVAWPLR